MERTDAQRLLKLAVLLVLTRGPLHGYRMMILINELTLGVINLTAGGYIQRLRSLRIKLS